MRSLAEGVETRRAAGDGRRARLHVRAGQPHRPPRCRPTTLPRAGWPPRPTAGLPDRAALASPRRALTPPRSALPWIDVAADFSVVLDELNTTLKSIEAVLRVDDMRNEIADLEQQAAAPDLWNDVEAAQAITSKLSYLQGDLRRVEELRSRLDDVGADARDGRGGGRRGHHRRDRARARRASATVIDELEVRTLLSGEYDSREALVTIRSEAGGRGRRRLGRDAHAHVPALGRAAQVPDRGLRRQLRGGGRHQVGHLRRQAALRLRHALRRAGHPPAGAHLAVRQPGPPADVVRRRRGAAGRRADRPRRDPRERDPGRRLPLLRPRWAERQHHRLRRPDDAHPDRHRGVLPEREVADPEPRRGAAGAAGPAARRPPGGAAGRDGRAQGRGQQLGQPDALLRPAPVPDGQGPADRARDRQHRRRSWTATSTRSSRPASAGGVSRRPSPRTERRQRPALAEPDATVRDGSPGSCAAPVTLCDNESRRFLRERRPVRVGGRYRGAS